MACAHSVELNLYVIASLIISLGQNAKKTEGFNNGTCNDKISDSKYDFQCQFPFPYYGKRCELRLNLSLNSTCVDKQGRCFINGRETICECFTGFEPRILVVVSCKSISLP